jgi:multisubunit Na+/H+ antiporter MnhF subunit
MQGCCFLRSGCGGMDKYDSFINVLISMIDTWLFTALVLGVLALCVILRSVNIRSPDDRLVAGTVTVTLVALTALTLSIAYGTLMILDIGTGIALIAFAVMIWSGNQPGAART